jgi:hypothetical protein
MVPVLFGEAHNYERGPPVGADCGEHAALEIPKPAGNVIENV